MAKVRQANTRYDINSKYSKLYIQFVISYKKIEQMNKKKQYENVILLGKQNSSTAKIMLKGTDTITRSEEV